MFGSNDFEHMVKKQQWEKIKKRAEKADDKARLAIASACGTSSPDDEEATNLLITLLRDTNADVVMQAVKSLGLVGTKSSKTYLQYLTEHQPEGDSPLKDAVQDSIDKISKRS